MAKRIASLDGLRAVSIALVIFSHTRDARSFAIWGAFGVRIFFVISGYLITSLLMAEIAKTGRVNLWRFYLRRSLRIFVPYYAYLLVLVIIAAVGLLPDARIAELRTTLTVAALYLSDYARPANSLLGHTWSLAVEEQFYLLWPALFAFARSKALLVTVIVLAPILRAVLVIAFHGYQMGGYYIGASFETACDALAVGCLLALINKDAAVFRWLRESRHFHWLLIAPVALVSVTVIDYGIIGLVGISVIPSALNLLIAASIYRWVNRPVRILNAPPVAFIGKISYSIYLWHFIFISNVFESRYLRFPLSLVWVFAASLASYYLIEQPALRLRQRIEYRPAQTVGAGI